MFRKLERLGIIHAVKVFLIIMGILSPFYYLAAITKMFEDKAPWIFGIAVLLALVYYLFALKWRNPSEINKLIEDTNEKIYEIRKIAKRLVKDRNYFGLKVFIWRLDKEIKYTTELAETKTIIFPALKTFEYHREIFGSVIKQLSEGDKYFTLSNLEFWSRDRYGDEENRWINYNTAAATRGVIINRIIIIRKEILENPIHHIKDARSLERIVKELYFAFEHAPTAKNHLQIRFFKTDDEKWDMPPVPFSFIENKEGTKWMTITPSLHEIEKNGTPPGIFIKIISDKETDMEYRNYKAKYDKLLDLHAEDLIGLEALYRQLQDAGNIDLHTPEYYLKKSHPQVLNPLYSIVLVKKIKEPFLVSTVIGDEQTVVMETNKVEADNAIKQDDDWRVISFNIEMPLTVSGFVSRVSQIFADSEIPICIHATYSSYFILVKRDKLHSATNLLAKLGCKIEI